MTTPAPTPGLANLTGSYGNGEESGLVKPNWSHSRNQFHYTQSSRPVAETLHEDATAEQTVIGEQQKIAIDLANSVKPNKSRKQKAGKSRQRTPVKRKRLTKAEQKKLTIKRKKQLVIARKKKAALKKKNKRKHK
jgi:hypothetical protein